MKETLILSKILLKNSLNINNGKSKLKATAKKLLVFFAVAYIKGYRIFVAASNFSFKNCFSKI